MKIKKEIHTAKEANVRVLQVRNYNKRQKWNFTPTPNPYPPPNV